MNNIIIPIPSLYSNSGFLLASSGSHQDHFITVTSEFLFITARGIIREEMENIEREHPEIDLERVQEYINAYDSEYRTLGYEILRPYTRYATGLLTAIHNRDNRVLEEWILDYARNNKTNITKRVL